MAIRTGALHRFIKEFIDQRIKLKLVERFAEQLVGAMADDARQRRQASIEYETKLKREKEEMERKQREKEEEERRKKQEEERRRLREREDEERRKRIDEQEKALEAKRKSGLVDDLMKMDLGSAKIRDIKDKMDELGLSYVGCTSRDDLINKLKSHYPVLKSKMDQIDSPTVSKKLFIMYFW